MPSLLCRVHPETISISPRKSEKIPLIKPESDVKGNTDPEIFYDRHRKNPSNSIEAL
ncbi:4-diphosphocytidyl-2-C-methyl-D-erythritol kinase [Desmospora sp. 8437]|nr:4-diphosphocytidyl-2-C-methyl-D-erythritol kinase [Desmospora sp. 8437]